MVKYIIVNDIKDVTLASDDFARENCEIYECGRTILQRILDVTFQNISTYLDDISMDNGADEILRVCQMIVVFKRLKNDPPVGETIREFVQDIIEQRLEYLTPLQSKPLFLEIISSLLTSIHKAANTFDPIYLGKKIPLLLDTTEYRIDVCQFVGDNLTSDFKIATDFLERTGPFRKLFNSEDVVVNIKRFYDKFQCTYKDFFYLRNV